jgi:hypothetical protein
MTRHPKQFFGLRRWFFAAIAATATAVTFVGFAPTYYLNEFFDTASLPARVHLHAVLFTAWVLLFLTQSALVATKRTVLHRRLGVIGMFLVIPMLVSGVAVAVARARSDRRLIVGPLADVSGSTFLVIPLTSVLLFALLAAVGLSYRHRPDAHKRFILLATIALLPPALGRIPVLAAGGPAAFFLVTLVFIIAGVAHDYFICRKIHPVTLWGGMVLAASFPGRLALANTEAWQVFARWVIGG